MTVHYALSFLNHKEHLISVKISCRAKTKRNVVLLSSWTPGSYMIRDHCGHIVKMSASVNGVITKIDQVNKSTWFIYTEPGDELVWEYTFYAWDWSVRTCVLSEKFAHLCGPAAFMRVMHHEHDRHELVWDKNLHDQSWSCDTTLTTQDNGWWANSFEEFVDHPLLFGRLDSIHWNTDQTPYRLSVAQNGATQISPSLTEHLKKICEEQVRVFGSLPECVDNYSFLVFTSENRHGGLEYHQSTSLLCSNTCLNNQYNDLKKISPYEDFLELCSHEHFHIWWVKAIRPEGLEQYDFDRENYTRLLWLFEGLTSYYAPLVLCRTGLISADKYFYQLAKTLSFVHSRPGYVTQSLKDSSFDAWVKYYKPNSNAVNAQSSYYIKGELVSLYTDLLIILQSQGRYCLDDVLQFVWRILKDQERRVMTEDFWIKAIKEVTQLDLSAAISEGINGTTHPDFVTVLEYFGVKLIEKQPSGEPYLGMEFDVSQKYITIKAVNAWGSAITAGLSEGDILLAIDYVECLSQNLTEQVKRKVIGQTSLVHFFRHGTLQQATLTWKTSSSKTYDVRSIDSSNPYLKKWLNI